MSEHYLNSQFNKSSKYYGMNNSSLYGANLGHVFAEGPPPLDDTTEEDDNDIVFGNNQAQFAANLKQTTRSCEDSSVANTNSFPPDSEEDDGFGDFAGFADFSSAMGTTDQEQEPSWVSNSNETVSDDCKNKINSPPNGVEKQAIINQTVSSPSGNPGFGCFSDSDGDFDEFEGFQSCPPEQIISKESELSPRYKREKNRSAITPATIQPANELQSTDSDKHDSDDSDEFESSKICDKNHTGLSNIHNVKANPSARVTSHGDALNELPNGHVISNSFGNDGINLNDNSSFEDTNSTSIRETSSQNIHESTASPEIIDDMADKISNHILSEPPDALPDEELSDLGAFNSSATDSNMNDNGLDKELDASLDGSQNHSDDFDQTIVNDNIETNEGCGATFDVKQRTESSTVESTKTMGDEDDLDSCKSTNDAKSGVENGANTNMFESNIDSTPPIGNDLEDFSSFSQTNAANLKVTSYKVSPIQDTEDGGDFSSFESKGNNISSTTITDDDNDFGDFSVSQSSANDHPVDEDFDDFKTAFQTETCFDSIPADNNPKTLQMESVNKPTDLADKSLQSDDEFGDFGSAEANTDNDIGDFSNFKSSKNDQSGLEDFGELKAMNIESTPTDNQFKKLQLQEKQADFAGNSLQNDDDGSAEADDFGDFSNFKSSTNNRSGDDEFGDFGSAEANDNDFGNVSNFKSSTNDQLGDDEFGDFGSAEVSTDDGFADFSSVGFDTKKSSSSSVSDWDASSGHRSDWSSATTSDSPFNKGMSVQPTQQSSREQEGLSIYKPQHRVTITKVRAPVAVCFMRIEMIPRKAALVQTLQTELQNNRRGMWEDVSASEKDGSLRLDWVTSCHQSKLLEALTMLPVRSQTSASFQSLSKPSIPIFAAGLGLLEPTKGMVTPFHHDVQDVNLSQDPFGLQPDLSISTSAFGEGLTKSPLTRSTTMLDAKDNSSDTTSESSSLDLDFLAPVPSTAADKPESRGIYQDDLLGLSLQSSDPNSASNSPALQSSGDTKKIFKFGNVLIPLNGDGGDRELSDSAQTIVKDFEDLSFMLSKVLMFPLKAN